MIGRTIDYLNGLDFSTVYIGLVLMAAVLGAAWVSGIMTDPANRYVGTRELQFRRVGLVTIEIGFLTSIMFASRQNWAPWFPMVLVALGFNVYLLSSLAAAHQRSKVCGACPLMAGVNSRAVRLGRTA